MVKLMEYNEDDLSSGITLRKLYENEKEDERKKIQRERVREYHSRPEVNKRLTAKRKAKKLRETLRNLGKTNPHKICQKLGHPLAHSRVDPSCFYKCSKCCVSYCEKQRKHFYNLHFCPCCHFKLRTRKTILQKRNLYG